MPILSPDSATDPSSEHQPDKRRLHPVLGIAIGLGALLLVLLLAAIVGGLLYTWLFRTPQATLAPLITTRVEGVATLAPQEGSIPTDSAIQSPQEDLPSQTTATPPALEGTLPLQTPDAAYILIVNIKSLNVRTGPSTQYPVIITYPEGTRLLAIGRNEDASWFVISITPNQQGWVSVPLVRYDFDRYELPVIPAPPLQWITPTPYGGAILVPPELIGSQPLAPILPAKRLISLASASLLTGVLAYLERMKLSRLARTSLRQVLVLGANLLPH